MAARTSCTGAGGQVFGWGSNITGLLLRDVERQLTVVRLEVPPLAELRVRYDSACGRATPLDEVSARVDLRSYDYVVTGKLNKSELQQHINFVPLAPLALLGVPYDFRSLELDFQVEMFGIDDLSKPLMAQSYHFEQSVPVGLYYNRSAN